VDDSNKTIIFKKGELSDLGKLLFDDTNVSIDTLEIETQALTFALGSAYSSSRRLNSNRDC